MAVEALITVRASYKRPSRGFHSEFREGSIGYGSIWDRSWDGMFEHIDRFNITETTKEISMQNLQVVFPILAYKVLKRSMC